MSTYESPYTAENPASFYHYSLHPDDLATRRSISVYSLKDPDRKKKAGRFPQCRVCFATMLLVSLGVAIAVAVTLAIMLSNPNPKFYRTKSAGNSTLSRDFLKEKEVDFGSDICQLMTAMFDLRDSSHQSRKVTDCKVFLADSPGNMVINLKLNVDETFIKSDSNEVKAMLVANAFVLSSNSSGEKPVISLPPEKTDKSSATSDVFTSSTTGPYVLTSSTVRSDVPTPSTTGPEVFPSSTAGSGALAPSTAGSDVLTSSTARSDVLTSSLVGSDVFSSSTAGSDILMPTTARSDDLTSSAVVSDILASFSVGSDNFASPAVGSDILTSSGVESDVLASSTVGSDNFASPAVGSDILTSSAVESDVLASSRAGSNVFTSTTVGSDDLISSTTGSHVLTASTSTSDVLTILTGSDVVTLVPSTAGSDVVTSATTGSKVLSSSTAASVDFTSPKEGSDVLSSPTVVSNDFTSSITGSSIPTPLITGPGVITTSTTGFDAFTSSTIGLSEYLSESSSVAAVTSSKSTSTAMLISNEADLDSTFRVSASSWDVPSSAFLSLNDESKASRNTIPTQESVRFSIEDATSNTLLSTEVQISPSASSLYQNVEFTSTHDKLSSSMSHRISQKSHVLSESVKTITTPVLDSKYVLSAASVPDLESSEQYTSPASTVHQVSAALLSHPGYTTSYNRHDTSSVLSSEYGSYYEDMTTDARVTTVPLYTSDMSITQLGSSPSSVSSLQASHSAIIPGEILKISVTPGIESIALTNEASSAPNDVSSSEQVSQSDLQSSSSDVSFSSAVRSLHSVASQHMTPSYVATSVVSDIASTAHSYLPDSGSSSANIISVERSVQTETPSPVLYPSIVTESADVSTLESDKSSQGMTVSVSISVPASEPPMARWLDTTMLMSDVALDNNTSSIADLPMMHNNTDVLSNNTVSELTKNSTLETSPITIPVLGNRTDSLEDMIKPVTVPSLQSEVRTPLLSTTQTPTTTTQDIGRAIFESDISNRAMGTASPEDFWDNILKMVQYTSTKKPKIHDSKLSTTHNISFDSKTFSSVDEGFASVTDSVVSDTLSASSTISYFSTESSPVTASLVDSLKPSESDIIEPRSSTVLFSEISADSNSFIRATPVLTAEPGLMSSIEQSVITEKPIMDNSTSEYRRLTSTIGSDRSLLSSDLGTLRKDKLLSTTQDASVKLFSSAQTSSPPSSTLTFTDDYAFYDLIPVSLVTSSPGPASALSSSIMSSSDIYSTPSSVEQLYTDDIDFYDLMPESKIASSVDVSSSIVKPTKITADPITVGTAGPAEVSSSFRSTVTRSAPLIDANFTTDMETQATLRAESTLYSRIKPSSTVIIADNPSLNIKASIENDSLSAGVKAPITPTIGASPSSSAETPSTDIHSSSLYPAESSSLGIAISTGAPDITLTPVEVTPSLATVSDELFGETLSVNIESQTTVSGLSPSVQKSSSEIKATTSLRVVASTTTEPPSLPAVFNVGSEFGNKLFFANDFSKMDFTRTDTENNDKSVPSSLFNTVPMIPRVTTPSVPRVRVPNLFQGGTNPFQTVPTTPPPGVTTPKVIPPSSADQKTSSSSSGQFLFDFGSLGANLGGSLGLGNINFN